MSDGTITPVEDEEAKKQAEAEAAAAAAAAAEGAGEGEQPGEKEVPKGEDFLSMSDEDFEKMEEPPVPGASVEGEEDPAGVGSGEEPPGGEEAKGEETPPAEEAKPGEGTQPAGEETPPTGESGEGEGSGKEGEGTELTEAQMAEAYQQLMVPFKANGKEVKVSNVDEAVRLMQMGAGHVKYQQKVRPMVAIAETLKQHKIEQSDLNFLIELHNKNPEAIAKLVRDADINPYDIDNSQESKDKDKDYRPKDFSVSDKEVTLRETIDSLQETETGKELLADVRTWDDDSRAALLGDPKILSVIADQKHSGVYDQVTAEIDRKRTLGELTGMTFLAAYEQVGSELDKNGAFKQTTEKPPTESKVIETAAAKPKPKANGDPAGVAPAKGSAPKPVKVDKSVLDMSDEDFAKLEAKFA